MNILVISINILLGVYILFCLYKKYHLIEGLEPCNATEAENKEYRSRGLTKNSTSQVLNKIKSKIRSLEIIIAPLKNLVKKNEIDIRNAAELAQKKFQESKVKKKGR